MKIVLDTNVLVSGLLNPAGIPGEIVRMTSSGMLTLCYNTHILAEYRNVLLRPKFHFDAVYVDALLDQIQAEGISFSSQPLKHRLPDPHDEVFLAIALAGKVRYLVTGNLKHYPVTARQGISVVSPSKWLEIYWKEK